MAAKVQRPLGGLDAIAGGQVQETPVTSSLGKLQYQDIDMSDASAMLRMRQTEEYQKLCRELRVSVNTAVLRKLAPPSAKDSQDRPDTPASLSSRPGSPTNGSVTGAASPHDYEFENVYLGDKQLRPLAAALSVDKRLRSLSLLGVGMFDSGMVALCSILRRSPLLEILDISSNRFSTQGAQACVALAQSAPKMRQVTAKDTALDPEFAERRGLPVTVTAARLELQAVLAPRQAAIDAAEAAAAQRVAMQQLQQQQQLQQHRHEQLRQKQHMEEDSGSPMAGSQPVRPQTAGPQKRPSYGAW